MNMSLLHVEQSSMRNNSQYMVQGVLAMLCIYLYRNGFSCCCSHFIISPSKLPEKMRIGTFEARWKTEREVGKNYTAETFLSCTHCTSEFLCASLMGSGSSTWSRSGYTSSRWSLWTLWILLKHMKMTEETPIFTFTQFTYMYTHIDSVPVDWLFHVTQHTCTCTYQ